MGDTSIGADDWICNNNQWNTKQTFSLYSRLISETGNEGFSGRFIRWGY